MTDLNHHFNKRTKFAGLAVLCLLMMTINGFSAKNILVYQIFQTFLLLHTNLSPTMCPEDTLLLKVKEEIRIRLVVDLKRWSRDKFRKMDSGENILFGLWGRNKVMFAWNIGYTLYNHFIKSGMIH